LIRTSYLVLFIILISIGVGTASALITITLSGDVVITGFLDMTGDKITNVGNPTISTDAATKAYVDSAPGTDTLALLGCAENEMLKFVGGVWTCTVDEPQVYETSETVLIEAGTSGGVPFEISCLEGDWMNVSDNSDNPIPDVKAISNPSIPINSLSYDLVNEPFSQITGSTGLVQIQSIQLFDVEATLTILCLSPTT